MRKAIHFFLFALGALGFVGCDDSDQSSSDGSAVDSGAQDVVTDSLVTVDDARATDAPVDAPAGEIEDPEAGEGIWPVANVSVGSLIPVPLLVSPDQNRPFNHSAETTISAFGADVAVSMINLNLDTNVTQNTLFRSTSVSVSHDSGLTWSAAIPVGTGVQPTDPVVRFGTDGQLWFASWDFSTDGKGGFGSVWVSKTGGDTWSKVNVDALPLIDKQWLTIDHVNQRVFVLGLGGAWALGYDGSTKASSSVGGFALGAYHDENGAHFLTADRSKPEMPIRVLRWDGTGDPQFEGPAISCGDKALSNSLVGAPKGFGRTMDGGQWILRPVREENRSAVLVSTRGIGADVWKTRQISGKDHVAFMPAGAVDGGGRVHAVWYDTTGEHGALMYSHSLSADLGGPWTQPIVVDPDASPGSAWYPGPRLVDASDRRLREYIDVSVVGNMVHLAWTHSPQLPSRVYTARIEVKD